MPMGENRWLPLNRYYKPLGLSRGKFVEYEDYSFLYIPGDEIKFNVLWDNGGIWNHGSPCFFTYSDFCSPRDKKNNERYEEIIRIAFFSDENINYLKFLNFWRYKASYGCEEHLERNLKKFNLSSDKEDSDL